jgi:hypothetical protein
LLRSCGPFFFRSSIFHLVHGFDKPAIVQHIHQLVDYVLAVARAGLNILSQYALSLLDRVRAFPASCANHSTTDSENDFKRLQFRLVERPLKELWRSSPSEVMSRYSTSA